MSDAGHFAHCEWLKKCHMSCAESVKHEIKWDPCGHVATCDWEEIYGGWIRDKV